MSVALGRCNARAPTASSSAISRPSPRTTATGLPLVLPLTRSAAPAISSATAATVTSRRRPEASAVPRKSSSTASPAAPMAMSVWPSRQGRPAVSVTSTPSRSPVRSRRAVQMARADASGSTGSNSTTPSGALLVSTPAAAMTRPCRFSTMRVTPPGCALAATTRTVSSVIACSRSTARATRPSALDTILLVTTTISPSIRRDCAASQISAPRLSPATISPKPPRANTLRPNSSMAPTSAAAASGSESCGIYRTSFGRTDAPKTSIHCF